MDRDGNILVDLGLFGYDEKPNLYAYQKDDKWGLWTSDGTVLTEAIYKDVGSFGGHDGRTVSGDLDYSWVQQEDGAFHIINNKGELVGQESYQDAGIYSSGVMRVSNGEKWGYLSPEKGMALDYRYDYASNFSEGVALVTEDGVSFLINLLGQRLDGAETERFYTAEDGRYLSYHQGQFNYYTAQQ